MSKRSSFDKIPKDFYATIDPNAIPQTFREFIEHDSYAEPCYGGGDLEKLLEGVAVCLWKSDIREVKAVQKDGLHLTEEDVSSCDYIITNPPYTKDVLLPLIDHWRNLKPTWLLLPADFMHNKYFKPYMDCCSLVLSVGRLYWFENTWVVKEPFDFDELPMKWDKHIEWYDHMKGIKHYTGWLDNKGNPNKNRFVRGTDNYCWYLFNKSKQQTQFIPRD